VSHEHEVKSSRRLLIASAHRYPDLARLWYRFASRELVPAFRDKGLGVEIRLFRDAHVDEFDPDYFPGAVLDAPRPDARDFLEFYDAVLGLEHDFIFYVDADVFILDGKWAASLYGHFEDPKLAAVSLLRRTNQPGLYALLLRAQKYRELPAPVLACRYEGLSGAGPWVNHQPGDVASISLRAAGERILDVAAEEAERRLADFHGTTVARASRELFGVFIKDRFDRMGGDRRYFMMGAYDNTLLGALYQALYDEPFATEPGGAHLSGSLTLEALRENLARSRDPKLLVRLTTYFQRSNRALALLAAYENIPLQPPRVFDFRRQLFLRTAVKILPEPWTRC
jgi:hypothetical protein